MAKKLSTRIEGKIIYSRKTENCLNVRKWSAKRIAKKKNHDTLKQETILQSLTTTFGMLYKDRVGS